MQASSSKQKPWRIGRIHRTSRGQPFLRFTTEYGKIQRVLERAAQRNEYDSATGVTSSNIPPGVPVTEATSPAYTAMSKYAAALEEKVIELETVVETKSVMTTETTAFAAIATTSGTTSEIAEKRAAAKFQGQIFDLFWT